MQRMHLCATLLPDRTVLVNGGAMMEESAADAMLNAEIYHPDIGGPGTWAMAATSRVARLYHSVALLMPDGKVITAGSNPARKTEELRIEVFWPPYLFGGPRPTCAPAATEVAYGGSLAAAVPGAAAIPSACLIRPGATTHSLDAEQRLVDLPIKVTGPDAVLLQLPAAATIPPGLVPAVRGQRGRGSLPGQLDPPDLRSKPDPFIRRRSSGGQVLIGSTRIQTTGWIRLSGFSVSNQLRRRTSSALHWLPRVPAAEDVHGERVDAMHAHVFSERNAEGDVRGAAAVSGLRRAHGYGN
jgi:hypothetical protein